MLLSLAGFAAWLANPACGNRLVFSSKNHDDMITDAIQSKTRSGEANGAEEEEGSLEGDELAEWPRRLFGGELLNEIVPFSYTGCTHVSSRKETFLVRAARLDLPEGGPHACTRSHV